MRDRSRWNKGNKNPKIDEVQKIPCENVPAGSKFKGYRSFIAQDLITQVKTTQYQLEQWLTPDGKYIAATLPAELEGHHFGPGVRRHILYQHHANRVPQNKICEELREIGINISVGQIDKTLAEAVDQFKPEKEAILEVGIRNSSYIQADDTGARHAGKNGFCTVIRNDVFAYYASTDSKSRRNLLKILQGENTDFVITNETIEYCVSYKFKGGLLNHVKNNVNRVFHDEQKWNEFLQQYAMTTTQKKCLTEGAMLGSLFRHGMPKDIPFITDDAGQFNLFIHALCWSHAIRNIIKVVTPDGKTCDEVENILKLIRDYYKELKDYAASPTPEAKVALWSNYDAITNQVVNNPALKKALEKLTANKPELLRVLDYPFIPLTNNGSERDIRSYVIKRKISGGTRSQIGRDGRDTFTTLCATCRKNGISFWSYLDDRIRRKNNVPHMADIIKHKYRQAAAP